MVASAVRQTNLQAREVTERSDFGLENRVIATLLQINTHYNVLLRIIIRILRIITYYLYYYVL